MSKKACQPFKEWLNTTGEICNMTERNGDMSYFCEAPDSEELSCKDVFQFRTRVKSGINSTTYARRLTSIFTLTTEAERQLLERYLTTKLQSTIHGPFGGRCRLRSDCTERAV